MMRAIRLRVEYLKNPIGIDYVKPRLSWNCEGGEKQTAYQILSTDEDGKLLWDSGRVVSSQMIHIPWSLGANVLGAGPVKGEVGERRCP